LDSESSAFDDLVRPVQDQMLLSIWRITRNAEDAEDALQESLTLIWKQRTRIQRHPYPRAFILRICVHCACDALRARSRRGRREKSLADSDVLQAKGGPVDHRFHVRYLHEDLSRALVRLPERQATAILMRYVLDLSYEEIGNALGCSAATSRVHVNWACKRLSGLLAHLAPARCKENIP
jgi:RNA polymerase sigma-70 factor (ECF subfamily)